MFVQKENFLSFYTKNVKSCRWYKATLIIPALNVILDFLKNLSTGKNKTIRFVNKEVMYIKYMSSGKVGYLVVKKLNRSLSVAI